MTCRHRCAICSATFDSTDPSNILLAYRNYTLRSSTMNKATTCRCVAVLRMDGRGTRLTSKGRPRDLLCGRSQSLMQSEDQVRKLIIDSRSANSIGELSQLHCHDPAGLSRVENPVIRTLVTNSHHAGREPHAASARH